MGEANRRGPREVRVAQGVAAKAARLKAAAERERARRSKRIAQYCRRNRVMATKHGAEALIAVWDGASPGTADMIDVATRAGLKTFVLQERVYSWAKGGVY